MAMNHLRLNLLKLILRSVLKSCATPTNTTTRSFSEEKWPMSTNVSSVITLLR